MNFPFIYQSELDAVSQMAIFIQARENKILIQRRIG